MYYMNDVSPRALLQMSKCDKKMMRSTDPDFQYPRKVSA
jgi:hypothetical protein